MPQQKLEFAPKGLYTNLNQFGSAPPGALIYSRNNVISRPGVLGVRRGRSVQSFFSRFDATDRTWKYDFFPVRLFNPKLRQGGTLDGGYYGERVDGYLVAMSNGTFYWTTDGKHYTKVNPAYGERIDLLGQVNGTYQYYGFELNGNAYVNTSAGVIQFSRPIPNNPWTGGIPPNEDVKQDWVRSGFEKAGEVAGLDAYAFADAGTGTAQYTNTQVAYRIVFGHRDPNGQLVLGAPTSRAVVVNNSGSTKNNYIRTIIPPNTNRAKSFVQLYRTLPSSSSSSDPGDDCGLILERSLPPALDIVSASRTGSTATINTNTAHGLTAAGGAKSIVRINSSMEFPTAASYSNFNVLLEGSTLRLRNGLSPYAIKTSVVLTGMDSPSISNQAHGWVICTAADSSTGKVIVVCQASSYFYVMAADGTSSQAVSMGAGTYAQVAAYNPMENKIYVLCTTGVGNQWNSVNAPTLVKIDCATLGVSSNVCALLPNGKYTINYYDGAALYCRLGFFKANPSAPLHMVLFVPSYNQTANAFLSTDNGVSWTTVGLFPKSPLGDGWWNPQGVATEYRQATGELWLSYAYRGDDHTYDGDYDYYWETTVAGTMKTSGNSYTTVKTYDRGFVSGGNQEYVDAIAFNSNGNGVMARCMDIGSTSSWKFYKLSNWDSTPGAVGATSVAACIGGNNLMTDDVLRVSIVAEDPTNNTFLAYIATKGVNYNEYNAQLARIDVSGATPIVTLLPAPGITTTSDSWKGASIFLGAGSAIIKAGSYEVLTTPTSASFTITSLQTPQTDFTTKPIVGTAELVELLLLDTIAPEKIGAYLYTSPAVEGIVNANYPPPLANDIAAFRTFGFYACVKQKATSVFQLLKLPTVGEIFYIGGLGQYITAASSEDITNRKFAVSASSNLDTAIRDTISSMARVVNAFANQFGNTMTTVGFLPQELSSFNLTGVNFSDSVRMKHVAADGITLIQGTVTPNDFTQIPVQQLNHLAYSKTNQPDAVPLLNYLRIGSDTKEIKRIIASRDALFVFKEEGAYIVRGYGPPWQVDPFDLTLNVALKDSIVATENIIFGAFTRGIFKISDSGADLISLPINDTLEPYLTGWRNADASRLAFGLGDNSDHKFIFSFPDSPNMDYCNHQFVYDTFTNEWTEWQVNARHIIVDKDGKQVHAFQELCNQVDPANDKGGNASGFYPAILIENKDILETDFHDGIVYRIPNATGDSGYENVTQLGVMTVDKANKRMRLNTNGVNQTTGQGLAGCKVNKYDVIVPTTEGPGFTQAIMVAADAEPGDWFPYFNEDISWLPDGTGQTAVVKVYRSIPFGWRFKPSFPGTPAATNHYTEFSVSFREAYTPEMDAWFELPQEQRDPRFNQEAVKIDGVAHFGPVRTPSFNNFIRTYVPRQTQRGTSIVCGIATGVCGKNFESNGMVLTMVQGSLSFQRR